MGRYRAQWLVDDDVPPSHLTNAHAKTRFDSDELDSLHQLPPREPWEEDGAVRWEGDSSSDDLDQQIARAVEWTEGAGRWQTTRVWDSETGETVWFSVDDFHDETDGEPPAFRLAARERTTGEPDAGIERTTFPTVADAQNHAVGWFHEGWKILVLNSDGETVASSNPDGSWNSETVETGEAPRDGETFDDYLARLRARTEDDAA